MGTGDWRDQVKPLRDLMAKELPPESGEEGYRRGYRDGFIAAWEALDEEEDETELAPLLAALFAYWKGPLSEWAKQGGSAEIPPPELTLPS